MAKTNEVKIQEAAQKLGLQVGNRGFDEKINLLSAKALKEVIMNMEFATDTDIKIQRKSYVIEIDIVDNEIDLNVLTKAEYINRYGDERYDN